MLFSSYGEMVLPKPKQENREIASESQITHLPELPSTTLKHYHLPAPARTLVPTTKNEKEAVAKLVDEKSFFDRIPKITAEPLKRLLWDITKDWYSILVSETTKTAFQLESDTLKLSKSIWNFSRKLTSAIYGSATSTTEYEAIVNAISSGLQTWYNSALDLLADNSSNDIDESDLMAKKISAIGQKILNEVGITKEGMKKMISKLSVDRNVFKTLYNRAEPIFNELVNLYEKQSKKDMEILLQDTVSETRKKLSESLGEKLKQKLRKVSGQTRIRKSKNPLLNVDQANKKELTTMKNLPKSLQTLANKNSLGLTSEDISNIYEMCNSDDPTISNYAKQMVVEAARGEVLQPGIVFQIFTAYMISLAFRGIRRGGGLFGAEGRNVANAIQPIAEGVLVPIVNEILPNDYRILINQVAPDEAETVVQYTLAKIQEFITSFLNEHPLVNEVLHTYEQGFRMGVGIQ